jgi:hypothetical protein
LVGGGVADSDDTHAEATGCLGKEGVALLAGGLFEGDAPVAGVAPDVGTTRYQGQAQLRSQAFHKEALPSRFVHSPKPVIKVGNTQRQS